MQSVPISTDIASSNLDQGDVYNIMWQSLSVTCDRSVVFSGSSTNKIDRHDITEILLTVALNAIKQNKQSTLLRQGFLKNPLIVYFKTFFGRYQYLVEKSSVTYVQMTKDGIDNYIFVQRWPYMPTLPIYAVVYRICKSSTAYRF